MQRFCRASLRALIAEDALRSVFPLAGFFIDLHVHGADPQALPTMDAFALVAVDAQKRKKAHRLEEHRDGTQVFAERPVILERKCQSNTCDVIKRVPGKEQPEHDLLQICDFHQEQAGHQCQRQCEHHIAKNAQLFLSRLLRLLVGQKIQHHRRPAGVAAPAAPEQQRAEYLCYGIVDGRRFKNAEKQIVPEPFKLHILAGDHAEIQQHIAAHRQLHEVTGISLPGGEEHRPRCEAAAYLELAAKSNVYKLPLQPSSPNTTSREPYALEKRHAAYSEMLSLLTLSDRHRENLHERGLPDEIIARNGYKSMPETESERRLLASLLACDHELHGLPGFYTKDGTWTLAGANGFLIPVRNKDGLIQGMKIRLDGDAARKYRWLSSRPSRMENGARSYSWIHVTGDTTQKRAYLTEGPLKGDIASYFANNALFVCLGGVNAYKGLQETLLSLGVTEVMEAMDMDQFTNPQVRQAIVTLRREVQSIPGIRYYQCTWNPRFKGVDDYLLDWTKRRTA